MSLEYEVTFEPSAADTNQLAQGLSRYAVSEVGDDGFWIINPFELSLLDEGFPTKGDRTRERDE